MGTTAEQMTVLLFEDGPIAVDYTTVDKDGKFRFAWLKRRSYRMVVYRVETNTLDLKEFNRDLRNNDLWSGHYNVNENFALVHYLVVTSATSFFDSGNSDLDSDAQKAIDTVSSALPTSQYRLIIFGHADETGGQERNMELSRERAESAFTALT